MTPWMTEQDCAMKDFEYTFQFQKTEEHFDQLWQMKSSARESLKDWLLASSVTPKIAETCANACSELIENCVKYGREESVAAVAIHVTNTMIEIETVNATEPEHAAELRQSLDELNAADDLKKLFVQKLLHPMQGKSHLGLIKIVMETKGALRMMPHAANDIAHVALRMNAV